MKRRRVSVWKANHLPQIGFRVMQQNDTISKLSPIPKHLLNHESHAHQGSLVAFIGFEISSAIFHTLLSPLRHPIQTLQRLRPTSREAPWILQRHHRPPSHMRRCSGDPMPISQNLLVLLKPGDFLQWGKVNMTAVKAETFPPTAFAPSITLRRA